MNPTDANVSASGVGAETLPALRLSVVAGAPVPSAPGQGADTLLPRPAQSVPASWAPALPVAGTSLLPSPGAAARARFISVLLRSPRPQFTSAHSGGSAPAFKTCRQPSRAGAPVPSSICLGLTPACSGLASLVADARRYADNGSSGRAISFQ